MPFIDISYLQFWPPSCLVERYRLGNFGKGHYEEHFCENILNLDQWFRCCSSIYLILSSVGHLVQRSRTVWAILVKGIMRIISIKLF